MIIDPRLSLNCLLATVLPPDRRRSVEGNRLIIRGVGPNDAGVLQCSAENEHGSILANAVLTVAGIRIQIFVLLSPLAVSRRNSFVFGLCPSEKGSACVCDRML